MMGRWQSRIISSCLLAAVVFLGIYMLQQAHGAYPGSPIGARSEPSASSTAPGLVEFATDVEAVAKTMTDRAVTPANLAAVLASPGNIGTATPGSIVVTGVTVSTSAPPATAGSAGVTGTIAWDTDYIYVCTNTNTWKRVPLSTW